MNARKEVLIVDVDERVLLDLQHILEDAGFDTTVTWDVGEAREFLRNLDFKLLMMCDHPPEVIPREFLAQVSSYRRLPRCIILKNPGQGSRPGQLPSGMLAICKRNYEEILRTVETQLRRVRVVCAS